MFIHRKVVRSFALTLTALASVACRGEEDHDDFADAAPEQAALQLQVTDDTASEGLATNADSFEATSLVGDELDTVRASLDGEPAAHLGLARDAVRDINDALRRFLQPVVALVRESDPTTDSDHVRVWGPLTRGETEYRFTMRKGAEKRFGWMLEARAQGTNDPFMRVGAGGIVLGEEKRRGIGAAGFDLDALAAVDPTVVARGELLVGFAHGRLGTTLSYAMRDFTRDVAQSSPLDALIRGVHLKSGTNRVRLAYRANLPESATTAEELVLARVRHHRGIGGRSDAIVMEGDVPAGKAWVISQCWDAALSSGYRIVRECPLSGIGGESCTVTATEGRLASCVREFANEELPPDDAEAPFDDSEDPYADVAPPDRMPTGDATSN